MADFTKFRSSMGGFKRSDVTNYIESLCAGHHQATKKMQEEKEALSAQLAQVTLQLEEQAAAAAALQQKLSETETALASAEDALTEALTMMDEQKAEETPDYPSMELDAYRRAEAAERLASERAARLRQKLDDLIATVSARYEQSGQELQVLSEDLQTNLQRLQETLSDLEVAFNETSAGFDNLEDEELPTE